MRAVGSLLSKERRVIGGTYWEFNRTEPSRSELRVGPVRRRAQAWRRE